MALLQERKGSVRHTRIIVTHYGGADLGALIVAAYLDIKAPLEIG
jgi:hypothetical protein